MPRPLRLLCVRLWLLIESVGQDYRDASRPCDLSDGRVYDPEDSSGTPDLRLRVVVDDVVDEGKCLLGVVLAAVGVKVPVWWSVLEVGVGCEHELPLVIDHDVGYYSV